MDAFIEAELIARFYDAALGRSSWQDVATAIVRLFDSVTVMLTIHKPVGNVSDIVVSLGITQKQRQAYRDHYASHAVISIESARRGLFDRAVLGSDVIDDNTLRRSLIYNEYLRPDVRTFHLTGASLRLPHGEVAIFGTHRPEEAAPFARNHVVLLDRLVPHMHRALEIRQRFTQDQAQVRALQGGLALLAYGAVTVASDGRITFANVAAERMLASDDGLCQRDDRLRARNTDDDTRLARAIANASAITKLVALPNAAIDRLRISRPSGRRPYQALVSPLGSDREVLLPRHPVAVVFITDPEDCPMVSTEALCQFFELSPAEARVVALLASGQSPPAISMTTGSSYNTVRTLLARAMAKTDTNSQLDLARLVLATTAVGVHRC
jgi:DNA-binding CsgD family transcriptional regulator